MLHGRVIAVHRVAAAGIVRVFAAFFEHIIDSVVEALEGDGRAVFAAFAAVIEDDIEDDFDLCFVESAHHLSEFADDGARGAVIRIALVWREEAERGISPVVSVDLFRDRIDERRGLKLVELSDRQKLDGCDAERFEMRDFIDEPEECAGFCGHGRRMSSHALDMAFVNDAFGERVTRPQFVVPVHGGALDGDRFCSRARAVQMGIGDVFE